MPTTYFNLLETSLRELLADKGILSAEQVDRQVADMD